MYRIAIIGPESTGKSTLTEALATHFKCPWVPEFARTYVEELTREYGFEDVCIIARKQIAQLLEHNQSNATWVFFDTDLIITKVWFLHCYQQVPSFVTEKLNERLIDFYLLCSDDIPWVADKVREHGHDRDYFFRWYKEEIEKTGTPYAIVNGNGEDRLKKAIHHIETHFKSVN